MDRAASSYVNGVSVKIDAKYRLPRRPTLPPGLSHFEPPSHLFCDSADVVDESGALELVRCIRKRRNDEISSRKQRIAVLQDEEQDNKEIEEIREDIALTPSVTPNSVPNPVTSVPAAPLQIIPNRGPLLPHTSMSVLTPTQSSTVEEIKKANTSVINLSEFESYSTNPFEEMELKTLNDKAELAMLLQPPNTSQQLTYGHEFQNFNPAWPPENAHHPPYQSIPQQQHQQHHYNVPLPAAPNSWIPNGSHPLPLHQHHTLEHKLEQMTLGSNGSVPGHNSHFMISQSSLRQAKSVPDLSADVGKMDEATRVNYPISNMFPSPDKRLSSRTPPPRFTSDSMTPTARPLPKPIIHLQSKWERNLSTEERRLVQQLHDMGFERERCARTVVRLGSSNQKEVVDQLLLIQKMEESGHSLESIESALDLLNGGDDLVKRLEQHLRLADQLSALGFEKKKIAKALVAAGNDRDKALDILLMM